MTVSKVLAVCVIVFVCGVLAIGAGAFVLMTSHPQQTPDMTNGTIVDGQTETIIAPVAMLPAEAFQVSEGSPDINITYPYDDRQPNGTLYIRGNVADTSISSMTVDVNGNTSTVPVSGGKFSASVNLTGPSRITLSATNSTGAIVSREMLLDGDLLSAPYEKLCGFDPLEPDSDSSMTAASEADNGDIDGYEKLDGWLPAFVKFRVQADPFRNDTDGDGLTDGFEILRTIPFCMPGTADTDDDGILDPQEDIDKDGLTNFEEQKFGTDPLDQYTDEDDLSDADEIRAGTNPLKADSDGDGINDGTELKLGMDPLKPDAGADASHTYSYLSTMPAMNVTITGKGDITREFRVVNETSEYYNGWAPKRGPLARIYLNDSVELMEATMPYPMAYDSPENLSIFYFNETIGMYLPVDSVVNAQDHTVKGRIPLSGAQPLSYGSIMVTLADVGAAYALNLEIFAFNYYPGLADAVENKIEVHIADNVNITFTRADGGKQITTTRTARFLPTEDEVIAYKYGSG